MINVIVKSLYEKKYQILIFFTLLDRLSIENVKMVHFEILRFDKLTLKKKNVSQKIKTQKKK